MQQNKKRDQWASSLGFILAAAGSAVGLGNIWKFPGKAYQGGGGTFLVLYIIIVAIIGITVMLTEFAVGRTTQANSVGAFRKLNPKWTFVGWFGVITGFVILCYYSHVGGWVLKYIVAYIIEPGTVYADPNAYFLNFLGADGSFPLQAAVIFPIIFMGVTVFIIIKGVSGGIEKANKILMPALFIILIIVVIRSVTLPGAAEGIKYMTTFDLANVNATNIMGALGQAFFSLSLGMAIMVTYGSYLKKEENLFKNTLTVCSLDTLVALLAGFAIVPAVFATTGGAPGQGGGFAFVSLATVFQAMPMGNIFGLLFYVLLFFAALTSAMSLLEGSVAYVCEERNIDRKKATITLGVVMFLIGLLYTLGQAAYPIKGIWFDAGGIQYPGFGDFMEYFTDRLMTPLTSLMFCIFVGWIWGTDKAVAEIESEGNKFPIKTIWSICVKFVAPAAIIIIMLGEFGILKF